jgi:siroheme synthase-like protein
LLIAPSFLVIGALSDRSENDRICTICRKHGILFNNADGKPGDVVIPAMTNGAHYTVAVSTGSESPAVSRFIREEIERNYPALDAMVSLQHKLRETLKKRMTTPEVRRRILWSVIRDKTVWRLLSESPDKAWERVTEKYLS